MTEKLTIVSVDSHATAPPEVWSTYLEKRYHDFLPGLEEENDSYTRVFGGLIDQQFAPEILEYVDKSHAYRAGGVNGLWDADVRLAEMDREGVAAELVYYADARANSIFYGATNRRYDPEVCQAGVRAYHRWAADVFGAAKDRILVVGVTGPCNDIDQLVTELEWISDHGFAGTFAPGFTPGDNTPPLFDEYWAPFWQACEERGLPVVVHAGYGAPQGVFFDAIEAVRAAVEAEGGPKVDPREMFVKLLTEDADAFAGVAARRPMWQMMLGGVFDRHPGLRLLMTEVRGDWLPATLRRLDQAYLQDRTDLPAKQKPSEYWQTNCLVSLSFVKRAEVPLRHDIGMDTVAFGRDYPHPEGTWPNTADWLNDALFGVPDHELRKMLGENAIRFLGLDRSVLARTADRIGPTIADITGVRRQLDPRLIAHWDLRGGYLKPAEGDSRIADLEPVLQDDLLRVGARN
jgi:predicted TIM-barrel fold metal-dependent hydrolase